jgi:hypothetical protein
VRTDHADDDKHSAAERKRIRPLAEDDDAAERGGEHAGSARRRIDDRHRACSVAGLEAQEIGDVQNAAASDEEPLSRPEHRMRKDQGDDRRDEQEDRRDDAEEPDELDAAAGALGQEVPGGMTERSREDEAEREPAHRRREITVERLDDRRGDSRRAMRPPAD